MLRTELRAYQCEARDAALPHPGFAFFAEQRTGKLLTSLAIVDHHKPDIIFVVCPKGVIREWHDQLAEHLDIDWDCQIEVMNYDKIQRSQKLRTQIYGWTKRAMNQGKKMILIADEAHRIKKRGTRQSKFVRTLARRAEWRLALTGTPMGQGYENMWAIFDFMNHGKIFGNYESFEDRYIRYGGFEDREIIGYRHEEELKRIIHQYCYRITFDEARKAMGKKPVRVRRTKVYFDLIPRTRKIYDELEDKMEVVINGLKINSALPVTLPMKLQQVCGGYLIQDLRIPGQRKKERTVTAVGTEKESALIDLLETMPNRKLVICARYTHEITLIKGILEDMELSYQEISGKSAFSGTFDTDAIVMQVRSGVGFDLSASNTYIFYSWDQSFIAFEQSRFRILNMDTTEQVNYYFLLARDTIEEHFYEAIAKKKEFSTLVLDSYRRRREEATSRHARRIQKTHREAQATP